MKQDRLETLLALEQLRRYADAGSFQKGERYHKQGCVTEVMFLDGAITATVVGREEYTVEFRVDEGELEYGCTCPRGGFCKHCVAAGLAWLAEPKQAAGKRGMTMDDVRTYLSGQDQPALVEMIIQQAMRDKSWREQLLLSAAKQSPQGVDLITFRRAIDRAIRGSGYVGYGGARQYARNLEEVMASIGEVLHDGHAREALELTEYMLDGMDDAMGMVDDSDGYMGGMLMSLEDLHHEACRVVKPDPAALAQRLFALEMKAYGDEFYGAVEKYADVLGETGIAAFRKVVEARWEALPTLAAGEKDDSAECGNRYTITRMMETLAELSGDIEAVVAIKRRNLSSAYHYLEIAQLYKAARQWDKALQWAEQGVKAFPKQTDSRLREFLAEEYHRRRRHDEALDLIWTEFTDSPVLERYQLLKQHADRCEQWPQWRESALSCLRRRIAESKSKPSSASRFRPPREDNSELVCIFLWEKDAEGAWREAEQGGCEDQLWLELAALREEEHPQDAIAIYRKRVEPAAEFNYEEAVRLLGKLRTLMTRTGQSQEFAEYLHSIRTNYKRKRNLMKLLDGKKWD